MPIDTTQLKLALRDLADLSDAEAAAALSTPDHPLRRERMTATKLGALWGGIRLATFTAGLKIAAAQTQSQQLAAIAGMVHELIYGPGFDSDHDDVPTIGDALIAARLCTQDEFALIRTLTVYPCGEPVTEDQVAQVRAEMSKADALDALEQRATSVFAWFINERINPARSGDSVPTWQEFVDRVGAA
jgi:hypothetical protein